MKGLLIFSILLITTCLTSAQTRSTVTGFLQDSTTNKPLAYATVTLFRAADSVLLTYRLSDDAGRFSISDLPSNLNLRILFSFSGKSTLRRTLTLSDTSRVTDLGIIKMHDRTESLEEVIVLSEIPPVIVRNDTIEYNASSFKTLPNALLEDLIKKLPGAIVDRNGNITVNGRPVTKIFVEGKDFFGSDPKIATRNLPANIIDKVQVTDNKEDKYLDPNRPAYELDQVLNVRLKANIKKGWFGKAYAGAGSSDRFEGGAIINTFRDTMQLSILGYANNLNNTGFSSGDLTNIGGFKRSGYGNMNLTGNNISIDGVSFGGGVSGITTSLGAGANFNHELNSRSSINLQYFYGEERPLLERQVRANQGFDSKTLESFEDFNQRSTSNFHQILSNYRNKLSTFRSFSFRPLVTISRDNQNSMFNRRVLAPSFDTARSQSMEEYLRNATRYSHDIIYNDSRFLKPGQILRLSNSLSVGRNEYVNTVVSKNDLISKTDTYNFQRTGDLPSFNSRTNLTFIKPVGKNASMTVTDVFDISKVREAIYVSAYDTIANAYVQYLDSLSGGYDRISTKNLLNLSVSFNLSNSFSISAGVANQLQSFKNTYASSARFRQQYNFVWPALRAQYKRWNLNYLQRATEPAVEDIQPVLNVNNPLVKRLGNLSLRPAITHSIGLSTGQTDPRKALTYNVSLTANLIYNNIIYARNILPSGVQEISPLNVNGSKVISVGGGVTRRWSFGNQNQFSIRNITRITHSRIPLIINNVRSESRYTVIAPSIEANYNLHDRFEIYPKYSFTSSSTSNSAAGIESQQFQIHRLEVGAIYRPGNGQLIFESSLDQQYNPGMLYTLKERSTLLNCAVNYVFLKSRQAVLKLSAYDLLNSNNGLTRVISDNYIQDSQTRILRRYILLSLTYNIRSFKPSKVGGKDALFRL